MLQLTNRATQWTILSQHALLLSHCVYRHPTDRKYSSLQIWVVLQRRIYNTRIDSVDLLKQRLVEEWHRL